MSETYTVSQVAKILGYSTNSIYTFLKNGRIKGVRVGLGRIRISSEELQRILQLKKTLTALSQNQVKGKSLDLKQVVEKGKSQLQSISDIHFDVSNLFDWFIGVASILLGFSMWLYSSYVLTESMEFLLPWLLPVQTAFILGGVGILITSLFSSQLPLRWHRIFHIVLTLNYIVYAYLKVLTGDSGGGVIFGVMSFAMIVNFFIGLRGLESFLLFITSFTLGICFLLFINPVNFDFIESIRFLEEYFKVLFFSLFIISITSAVLIWWAHRKKRLLFWILMLNYGLNFITFSFLLIRGLSWDKAIYLLITGLTCLLIPLWEWIALYREKYKGRLLFIHFFILISLSFAIVWIWIMESNIKDYASQNLKDKAYYASLFIESSIESVEKKVEELGKNNLLSEALNDNKVDEAVEVLKIAIGGNKNIRRLLVFKENGDVFSVYPHGQLTESNFAFRDYFKIAKSERKIFISDSFEAKTSDKRRVVTVSGPIISKEGNFIGVVAASVNFEVLGQILQGLASSTKGEYVVVVDEKKIRIMDPDPKLIGTSLNASNYLTGNELENFAIGEGYGFAGNKMLQAFRHVDPVKWYVQVQIPISEILVPTRTVTMALFLVVTAIVIILALTMLYLLRKQNA